MMDDTSTSLVHLLGAVYRSCQARSWFLLTLRAFDRLSVLIRLRDTAASTHDVVLLLRVALSPRGRFGVIRMLLRVIIA